MTSSSRLNDLHTKLYAALDFDHTSPTFVNGALSADSNLPVTNRNTFFLSGFGADVEETLTSRDRIDAGELSPWKA